MSLLKPRCEIIRPEITRLPPLTRIRRLTRCLIVWFLRRVVWICTRTSVKGLDNLPKQGAGLVVANHLGDADLVIGLAFLRRTADVFAKAELYDYPILGKIMEAYGVIWIHRGQPDRRALRAALQGFSEGRIIGIAPEGRESLTGELEEGTGGAAYLALKQDLPIIPVTFTGTENKRIYTNLKHLIRTEVTMTVGHPFRLVDQPNRKQAIQQGTLAIMRALAEQLPVAYRGVYLTDTIVKERL